MKTKRINLIKGYFRNASNTLSLVMEFDIEIFTLHKDYKKMEEETMKTGTFLVSFIFL
ncbi:MAG: hypothetical protein LR001_06120 [Clostridiales bacterium]|nr:hypothetical protein [Clostridiales bacterium]